jgi:hypothetical protein
LSWRLLALLSLILRPNTTLFPRRAIEDANYCTPFGVRRM